MEKYFVQLSGNKLLQGVCDKLQSFGYKVIVVDWNEKPGVLGDIHLQMDVKDHNAIIKKLKEMDVKVDGAVTCIDLAVPSANAINEWCGNNIMPAKFVESVLTKDEMKRCWVEAGIFNRISKIDSETNFDEVYGYLQNTKIIIKPNVAASSRGITILNKGESKDNLAKALQKAKEISFDKHCLIEEFVEGREFTVDMLGDDEGNVCVYSASVKYHSQNALKNNNRVAVKIHWNANTYSDEVWDRIAAFGIQCYKTVGLNNSFGHLEIIMKPDGTFTPIEIGARSSGFICSHLVSAASGHDYLRDYIKMLHGGKIKNGHYLNGPMSSMWFGYDIPSGTTSIRESNLTKFLDERISVMYSKHEGLIAGMHFGDYVDDNSRDDFGYEMITGPRDILTIESIEKSEREFLSHFLSK